MGGLGQEGVWVGAGGVRRVRAGLLDEFIEVLLLVCFELEREAESLVGELDALIGDEFVVIVVF